MAPGGGGVDGRRRQAAAAGGGLVRCRREFGPGLGAPANSLGRPVASAEPAPSSRPPDCLHRVAKACCSVAKLGHLAFTAGAAEAPAGRLAVPTVVQPSLSIPLMGLQEQKGSRQQQIGAQIEQGKERTVAATWLPWKRTAAGGVGRAQGAPQSTRYFAKRFSGVVNACTAHAWGSPLLAQ